MPPGRQLRTHLLKYSSNSAFPSVRSSDETYSWNLQISGYLRSKNPTGAFAKYAQMRRESVRADSYSVGFLLKGCSSLVELQQAHSHAIKMGFCGEVVIQTALLGCYCIMSELLHARKMFDESRSRDLPLWNAIISAYSRMSRPLETLRLARAMVGEGFRPNAITATSVLSACTMLKDCFNGKLVHGFIIKALPHRDTLLYSALLGFYAHMGAVDIAKSLFEEMPSRDLVAWTAMIAAYSENNLPAEAFSLFKDLVAADFLADKVTILAASAAASKLQDPCAAEFVDGYAHKRYLSSETQVTNALILAHARCGNIHRACELFGGMPERTQVSWTSIIQALSINGRGQEALLRFSQMQISGVVPDELCYISVLSGCNRCGMVEEARRCFNAMVEEHGINPWIEHYASMIDLLCREGFLDEALEYLGRMPMKPDERLMRVFFKGCERMGRHCMAVKAAEELFGTVEIDGMPVPIQVNS